MPTYAWLGWFRADFERLTTSQQAAFLIAVQHFAEDLQRDRTFRKGLRVKSIQGATGIFEMTWAANGQATFQYGDEVSRGEPHVVWRRVGTHAILSQP